MLPKKLTIQGLYSYQAKQTIDFERLLDSRMFGIFGTVGSGKSSVLEAISFAIYGQTERLNSRDNRNYNMMNLKSNELMIDFECTNHLNEDWRFIVQGKRAGKDFENVKAFSRRILHRKNGDWQAVEEANPDDIIGLSYDNFRRTIIIPQGKFQEFLQLGDADRTRMLKEIFNLDKFEFSIQTNSLIKSSSERMENLRGQMLQYSELSTEAITLQEEKAAELQKELDSKRKVRKEKEDAFTLLEKTKEKHQKRAELQNRLSELEKQQDEITRLEKSLRQYERCFRLFSEPLSEQRRLKKDKEKLAVEAEANRDTFGKLQSRLKSIDEQWTQANEGYQKRDERLIRIEDFEKLLGIKQTEQKIGGLSERIGRLKREQESAAEKLGQTRQEKQTLDNQIEEKLESLPDEKLLSALGKWYSRQKDLAENLDTKTKELKVAQQRLRDFEANLKKGISSCNNQLGTAFSEALKITEVEKELGDFITRIEKQVEELQQRFHHLSVHQKLGEFADALEHGTACPLCGSTEHPEPFSGEKSGELDEIQQKLSSYKKQLHEAREFKSKFSGLSGQMDVSQQQISELEKQRKELKNKLQKHEDDFSWSEFDKSSSSKYESEQKRLETEKDEISRNQSAIKKLEMKAEEQLQNLEKEKNTIRELEGELNQLRGVQSSGTTGLKTLSYSDYGLIDSDTIRTEMGELREKVQQNEETYNRLKDEREQVKEQLTITKTQLDQVEKQLQTTESQLKAADEKLRKLLEDSEFSSAEEVESVLAAEPDTEKLRERIDDFNRQLHSVKEQKAALDAELGEQTFNEQAYITLKNEIDRIRNEVDQLIADSDAAIKQVEKLKTDLEAKNKLQSTIDQLSTRLGDLDTLKKLFSGSGFVNYISSVYLRQLCDAANKRFYVLTRQQLRLELTDKNNFQVRDFLNDGRLRSVKTLSGGQTFQASLCLALALAESVQHRHKTEQNFFFLDEGFGSLDKESLQTVFETLKSLRQESRVVGIISHVEELQQEIDVFLNITNSTEKGSLINRSWE